MAISKEESRVLLKAQQGEYDAEKKYISVADRFPEVEIVKMTSIAMATWSCR